MLFVSLCISKFFFFYLHHLLSDWRTFDISCRACLLAINLFCFCLFVKIFIYLSVYFTGYRILYGNAFSSTFNPLNISLCSHFFFLHCFWWAVHWNSYIHWWGDFSTSGFFPDFSLYFWFSIDYNICMCPFFFILWAFQNCSLKHVIILESSWPLLLQILVFSSPFFFWHFNYVYKTPFDVVQSFQIVCSDFF